LSSGENGKYNLVSKLKFALLLMPPRKDQDSAKQT